MSAATRRNTQEGFLLSTTFFFSAARQPLTCTLDFSFSKWVMETFTSAAYFQNFTQAFFWQSFYAVNLRWNSTFGPPQWKDFSPPIHRVIGHFPPSDVNNFMKYGSLQFTVRKEKGRREERRKSQGPPNAAHHFHCGQVTLLARSLFVLNTQHDSCFLLLW